jgi:hypothetical protein
MESEISFSVEGGLDQLIVLNLAMSNLAHLTSSGGGPALSVLSSCLNTIAEYIEKLGVHGVLQGAALPANSTPRPGYFYGAQISLIFLSTNGATAFEHSWDRVGDPLERWEKPIGDPAKNMSSLGDVEFQDRDAFSEVTDGAMPMYFDPKSKTFWAYKTINRSQSVGYEEYVTYKNFHLPEIERHICMVCGRDLGPGKDREAIDYGPKSWKCDNEDCAHVYPVTFWLGYKPEGEESDAATEATYVTLDSADATDGVYELAWHDSESRSKGFVTCEAGLKGFEALDAASEQEQREPRYVAIKRGESVTLLNRTLVMELEDDGMLVPSFALDEDRSQIYERIDMQPTTESGNFDEANLKMGCRIVENESSKLLGMMHADVSYRQIQTSPIAIEDWPGMEEQEAALLDFVLKKISAALPPEL